MRTQALACLVTFNAVGRPDTGGVSVHGFVGRVPRIIATGQGNPRRHLYLQLLKHLTSHGNVCRIIQKIINFMSWSNKILFSSPKRGRTNPIFIHFPNLRMWIFIRKKDFTIPLPSSNHNYQHLSTIL